MTTKKLLTLMAAAAAIAPDGINVTAILREAAQKSGSVYGSVEDVLREAHSAELGQIAYLVSDAIRNRPEAANVEGYFEVQSIYADRVVIHSRGRYWSYPYQIGEDNKVQLGERTEVVVDYEPVGARVAEAAAGVFIEALAAADASAPPRYLVRVIRAGLSGNGVNYPREVLREAVPLFENARVFVKSDAAHVLGSDEAKDFRGLIGRLTEARFVESGVGEIQAVLDVFETCDVAPKLREAVARGMSALFGLSIDASGNATRKGKFREATKLTKVSSVDLIIEPGAGGQVIRFVEAQNPHQESNLMLRQQMLSIIEARDAKRAKALADASDEEVMTAFREAAAGQQETPAPAPQAPALITPDEVNERIRMVEARAEARATIAASNLPDAMQQRLQTQFREATSFTVADVTSAIEGERGLLASLREGAQVRGLGGGSIEAGEDRAEKVTAMFDDFFDRKKAGRSFREAYIDVTGDQRVTGRFDACDKQRLREAVGGDFRESISAATFSDILGDSITRAMIREYGALEAYGDWRWCCDVVPTADFRTQERTRMGGYGNLPAVAENGAYAALTSPGDDKATYAASKRGGIETVSLETIANDDVGVIRRIPVALATAAGRTLYEFVHDFMGDNAAIYDGTALFIAGHSNLGVAALDATSFAAARLAVKKQTELTSGKLLGLTLRHLAVPADLEEKAYDLFVRSSNQDETFVQSRKPLVHVVDYWTDANNWVATADISQTPLIEIGFYGGKEDPEIFVQDSPSQGSLFSNDQIKYKIRHIYGGAVVDYRGFYGAVVV